jgi:hypothetical protein
VAALRNTLPYIDIRDRPDLGTRLQTLVLEHDPGADGGVDDADGRSADGHSKGHGSGQHEVNHMIRWMNSETVNHYRWSTQCLSMPSD